MIENQIIIDFINPHGILIEFFKNILAILFNIAAFFEYVILF